MNQIRLILIMFGLLLPTGAAWSQPLSGKTPPKLPEGEAPAMPDRDADSLPEGDAPTLPGEKNTPHLPGGNAPTLPGGTTGQGTKMTLRLNTPREFPHAGVTIALPVAYESLPIRDPYQILVGVLPEGRRSVQSVSLSAYPVREGITAAQFSDVGVQNLQDNLAIRRLEFEPLDEFSMGEQTAMVRTLRYRHRGIDTLSRQGVLIRTIPGLQEDSSTSLAYVLTVEVSPQHADDLNALFSLVAGGVRFQDVQRPIDLTPRYAEERSLLKDFARGFAIRQPIGWSAGRDEIGLDMGQMDYTIGGMQSPAMGVVMAMVPAELTAQQCGEKALAYEQDQGWQIEILSSGPARLDDKDAWEYVLKKSYQPPTPQPTTNPTTDAAATDNQPAETTDDLSARPDAVEFIEVRRLLSLPPEEETRRHYAVILACYQTTPEKTQALAEELFATFRTIDITKPTEKDEVPKAIRLPGDVPNPFEDIED